MTVHIELYFKIINLLKTVPQIEFQIMNRIMNRLRVPSSPSPLHTSNHKHWNVPFSGTVGHWSNLICIHPVKSALTVIHIRSKLLLVHRKVTLIQSWIIMMNVLLKYNERTRTVSNVTPTADVNNNVRSVYLLMIVLTVFVGRVEQGRYVSLMMSDDLHPQVCSNLPLSPRPNFPAPTSSVMWTVWDRAVKSRAEVVMKIIILGGRLFIA